MVARAGWVATIAALALMAGAAVTGAKASAKHDTAKVTPAPVAPSRPNATKPVSTNPAKPLTRRQEVEHAIETRTIPERYRSSVPKEYQKYIPFAKDR
ncbi:hypothetical protein LPW26_00875 [Rhodopseudomonas sp. HC1]|uniref:hypothetical protein n=1 Tax=Rhodopseudomonas infernalis TaxID=2897386 RepID=UPI001EE89A2C|nr:hypothetical protein [Rhodopseudomonas infernalis]MCG6203175.1 hypothetical protein [Rhodopseudomonas infernalis]